ncbi:MAG: SPW repeat protein [Firmicutes bacterium]|nr:SPW repeat protein [Bacillota bacterium]
MKVTWQRIATLVFGIFFIVSPWIIGFADQTTWLIVNLVLGVILAGLSAWAMFSKSTPAWLDWVNAVLGLYFLLTPFSFLIGFSGLWMYVSIVLGAVTLILSAWQALSNPQSTNHTASKSA